MSPSLGADVGGFGPGLGANVGGGELGPGAGVCVARAAARDGLGRRHGRACGRGVVANGWRGRLRRGVLAVRAPLTSLRQSAAHAPARQHMPLTTPMTRVPRSACAPAAATAKGTARRSTRMRSTHSLHERRRRRWSGSAAAREPVGDANSLYSAPTAAAHGHVVCCRAASDRTRAGAVRFQRARCPLCVETTQPLLIAAARAALGADDSFLALRIGQGLGAIGLGSATACRQVEPDGGAAAAGGAPRGQDHHRRRGHRFGPAACTYP